MGKEQHCLPCRTQSSMDISPKRSVAHVQITAPALPSPSSQRQRCATWEAHYKTGANRKS